MSLNGNDSYILTHPMCEICVWSENGFYNPKCAHCKFIIYGKSNEPKFMRREMAEFLGLVTIKGQKNDGSTK